ncbi:MAG: response regulator [Hydrogenophaga sp.]|nr:response regulator [Hydrogenophaga sp.]
MSAFERFILIDDNEADNVFHEIMIRRSGFGGEILIFESGIDALSFFRSDPMTQSTCILLDINMPMMSGFEMAATDLLQGKNNVVMVMLTSSGSSADRDRASTIPVIQGFLTKPVTVPVLSELMAGSRPSA